jgi:hypothetical protein
MNTSSPPTSNQYSNLPESVPQIIYGIYCNGKFITYSSSLREYQQYEPLEEKYVLLDGYIAIAYHRTNRR